MKVRASAQGLFMLMTNGLGASIGTILAGMVINHYCHWTDDGYLMGDWKTCWFIFAGYALVVAVAFAVLSVRRKNRNKEEKGHTQRESKNRMLRKNINKFK